MRNIFIIAAAIFTCLSCPTYARTINCPNLTPTDVASIIDSGTISTEQSYTLADEAKLSRAQVLINEPTANPFDTFYQMTGSKKINGQQYFIYVSNVLANSAYEAKVRAKKILLNDEKTFSANYDTVNFVCPYKKIDATKTLQNYPFKSTHESVVLNAVPMDDTPDFIHRMMTNNHHV